MSRKFDRRMRINRAAAKLIAHSNHSAVADLRESLRGPDTKFR
jgi:hypothetical protein